MGNHSLFSIEEATLGRGRTTSVKKQSNMRIGLVLLSALVVLAFMEEASADPRELAEDRGNVYDSYEECQKALEQQENDYGDYKLEREELECKPTHWGGWIALSIFEADYRDDLVADDRKKGGKKCKKNGAKKCPKPKKKKGRR